VPQARFIASSLLAFTYAVLGQVFWNFENGSSKIGGKPTSISIMSTNLNFTEMHLLLASFG